MGRKCKPKVAKTCVICGDKASGINFNALTCMSCKAFFRRNAPRDKPFQCPFNDQCNINIMTRKFCGKCRLRRCFEVGMKKEWILTEEEKQQYKNKVLMNRMRREKESQQSQPFPTDSDTSNHYSGSDHSTGSPDSVEPNQIEQNLDEMCQQLLETDTLELNEEDVRQFFDVTDDIFKPEVPETSQAVWNPNAELVSQTNPMPANTTLPVPLNSQLELGLPPYELTSPELVWLHELYEAGTLMQNHANYKTILEYQRDYSPIFSRNISQYFFTRAVKMIRSLRAFSTICPLDQATMFKQSLLEVLTLRSVLAYHPDRNAWCFVDDANKVAVMVPIDIYKPFCAVDWTRHQNLPMIFREEWKRDAIIFDLLTALMVFRPRPGMVDGKRIEEHQNHYARLLRRYLTVKYRSVEEAEACFARMQANFAEMRILNADLFTFYSYYNHNLAHLPLYYELLHPKSPVVSVNAFDV